jgi:hypothetical protein
MKTFLAHLPRQPQKTTSMETEKPKVPRGPHLASPEEMREIISKQPSMSAEEIIAQHWRLVEASKRSLEQNNSGQSTED